MSMALADLPPEQWLPTLAKEGLPAIVPCYHEDWVDGRGVCHAAFTFEVTLPYKCYGQVRAYAALEACRRTYAKAIELGADIVIR